MNHDRPDCLRITDGTWQTWLSRCRGKFSSLAASLAVLLLIISSQNAFGQGRSFDGFSDLITFEEPARPIDEPKPRPMWGPVETDKISLANQAPVLLPFFNNGMVFGLPGTVTGPLSERTQLTGDWGGWRTELAEKGLFIDVYSMSNYQQNTAGGLSNAGWFVQNIQWSLNLDTGRAGLWSGGLLHFTMQSRYGPSPQTTFNSGASVPVYTGLLLPDPAASSTTLPSEYFLVQALSQKTSFLVGKISDVFIPDETPTSITSRTSRSTRTRSPRTSIIRPPGRRWGSGPRARIWRLRAACSTPIARPRTWPTTRSIT